MDGVLIGARGLVAGLLWKKVKGFGIIGIFHTACQAVYLISRCVPSTCAGLIAGDMVLDA